MQRIDGLSGDPAGFDDLGFAFYGFGVAGQAGDYGLHVHDLGITVIDHDHRIGSVEWRNLKYYQRRDHGQRYRDSDDQGLAPPNLTQHLLQVDLARNGGQRRGAGRVGRTND